MTFVPIIRPRIRPLFSSVETDFQKILFHISQRTVCTRTLVRVYHVDLSKGSLQNSSLELDKSWWTQSQLSQLIYQPLVIYNFKTVNQTAIEVVPLDSSEIFESELLAPQIVLHKRADYSKFIMGNNCEVLRQN